VRFPDGRFVSFSATCTRPTSGKSSRRWSARQGYPVVSRALAKTPPQSASAPRGFFATLAGQLLATVHKVERSRPRSWEVVVKAAARCAQIQTRQF